MPPQLAPVNPPLGPRPATADFFRPQQVTLEMKEKVFSLSGDDFTVKTADEGNVTDVCQCKGKAISARDKKKFTDMQGNELFTLENKLLSINKSMRGVSPSGEHDFEVKGHFKLLGTHSTCTFTNAANGQEVAIEIKGDWIDRSAEMMWDGKTVATIARSFFNVREILGDQQTYFVTVAPNVDLSLIAALCVSLDERANED
ncbi:hypothetical protein KC332_g6838 [Hortaea werneckii]|uniref:Tubby C-terminal domain-containing protein n=1 Tax=Hortaea werneckii TaxID=91943 RepID=A0A3M7HU54_HORWE|nr:hypothetical protein KC350_g15635 [Hortaea werneckii]KAI6834877.1 hypothetical protein KC358_g5654 [Hortaea werneckii]KAI6902820.1 hypothetical protein KC348_g15927 [Hortaea werneckii]KAI6922077.1 hypothetical protein KC341_g15576 [Hortaea werneckii]KAI6955570.1 hypothetical protein KC321_g15682 [Hortaea werneckii]